MMMILGGYPFLLDTAAPQEMAHTRAWNWVENEVLGTSPTLQYTGPKPEVITLKGIIYPEYYGGTLQMDVLSLLAGNGKPMLLVSGVGLVLGFWVVESIEETRSLLLDNGQPRKIEFVIQLKQFANLTAAIQMLIANPASAIGL